MNLYLALDIILVLICGFLLVQHGRLRHSHPAVMYLIFHLVVVTIRLTAIVNGAPLLFEGWGSRFEPVRLEEIQRAVLIYDAGLVIMTLGWLHAAADDNRSSSRLSSKSTIGFLQLDPSRIRIMAMISIPIGIIGFLTVAYVPGIAPNIDLGIWENSSYVHILPAWFSLGIIGLIYVHGFRRHLVIPMIGFVVLMILQGEGRFRVIIPTIFLLQIYLDCNQLKWPRPKTIFPVLILAILFFPMKEIGQQLQVGASAEDILRNSIQIFEQVLQGEEGDQTSLDQFAAMLTLTDRHGHTYFGTTYLAVFTMPIPRQIFPEKPESIYTFWPDITSFSRPMLSFGMLHHLHGESYVNFGYTGIAIIAYVLAYVTARLHFAAYRRGYGSVGHFAYLMLSVALFHMFRGGIISLIVYTLVNMMPLAVLIINHILFPIKKSSYHQKSMQKIHETNNNVLQL